MALKTISALAVLSLATVPVMGGSSGIDYSYYCGKDLQCDNGMQVKKHVLCEKTTVFAPSCIEPKVVPMIDEIKKMILDKHNELRNIQATGQVGGIFKETAADMTTMSWDDELEFMAIPNAMQCQMEHDKCHRTSKYKIAGQNLAYSCSAPDAPSIYEAAVDAVQSWFDEYKDVPSINEVRKLGSSGARKPIGHWTQVIQSKANRVGCAAVTYNYDKTKNSMKCFLIACNYNAANLVGYPIYNNGPAASKCKTGPNPKYPGLCSIKENVAQSENGQIYFNEKAAPSPVVEQWLNSGKKLDIGSYDKTLPTNKAPATQPAKQSNSSPSADIAKFLKPGQSVRMQTSTSYVNGKPIVQHMANGEPITQKQYDELKAYFG